MHRSTHIQTRTLAIALSIVCVVQEASMRSLFWIALGLIGCSDYELNTQEEVGDPPEPVVAFADPVAVAGPSVRMKRQEETILDASASFDPDDEAPEFDHIWWVVSSPENAVYSFTDLESPNPAFSAETLGVYEIGLLVIDKDGLESTNPAGTIIEILPWEDAEFELSWDIADVDLDLHLIRPDGAYYSDADDCYFGNPLPDWGIVGESRDDPHLIADSEGFPAPETIQLEAPEEGVYEVLVHYFSTRDASYIYATPTLKIWAEGQVLSVDIGPRLNSAGYVWKAGTLDWSTLTWTPNNELSTHADMGGPAINQ
jgi:hypothetical protein